MSLSQAGRSQLPIDGHFHDHYSAQTLARSFPLSSQLLYPSLVAPLAHSLTHSPTHLPIQLTHSLCSLRLTDATTSNGNKLRRCRSHGPQQASLHHRAISSRLAALQNNPHSVFGNLATSASHPSAHKWPSPNIFSIQILTTVQQ